MEYHLNISLSCRLEVPVQHQKYENGVMKKTLANGFKAANGIPSTTKCT